MNLTALASLAAAVVAALLPSAAAAQDLLPKSPPQRGPVWIVGATVHPVSGPPIRDAVLAFEDGIITELRPRPAGWRPPAGAEIIDGDGLSVYPGMIAATTQLGLFEVGAVRATLDFNEVGEATPEVRGAVSVNPDSALLPVTRLNGVLLAGVFPTGGRVPGRASVIRLDGWTWEDMTVTDDAGLVLSWPRMTPVTGWWVGRSESEQRAEIAAELREIDRLFDAAHAYHAARDADPDHAVDVRLEAMRGVVTAQRPLLINADDASQISAALAWVEQRGYRAVLVGGTQAHLAAAIIRRLDVPVIIPGTHRFPDRNDRPHDDAFTLPARLRDAGIRFCIDASDREGNIRNLPYEAALAARYGLTPEEAVEAITLAPARILGVADRYGSLEAGKSATLIVTDGSPLEITTSVLAAFIDGRRVLLEDKQTALRDKYEEKYRQLGLLGDE